MKIFEIAMPSLQKTFWHGTNNVRGQQIMRDGLVPDAAPRSGEKYIPARIDGIYLSQNITYALNFACRNNRQRYGWLFQIGSDQLREVEVDEDVIGQSLMLAYFRQETPPQARSLNFNREASHRLVYNDDAFYSEILNLAAKYIPAELASSLHSYSRYNPKWLADAGALLLPYLSESAKIKLINTGAHVASLTPITPVAAWRFDSKLGGKIHNEILFKGISVLDQIAERMR